MADKRSNASDGLNARAESATRIPKSGRRPLAVKFAPGCSNTPAQRFYLSRLFAALLGRICCCALRAMQAGRSLMDSDRVVTSTYG
jgi:hypothetical protein